MTEPTFDYDDDPGAGVDEYFDDFDERELGVPRPRKPGSRKATEKTEEEMAQACSIKTRQRNIMLKALSEQHMNEVLDWHLEEGCAYHVLSAGDIDFLTYVRGIVKQFPVEYMLCSTWCMAMEDAYEIASWLRRGIVKRCDVYVGEMFIQHNLSIFEYLSDALITSGGRLCVQRNHAKVMVGYWLGDDGRPHGIAVASSGNMNTNPRIEQTVITVDKEVADFYKTFFDGLKSRNKWPVPWKPYEVERCPSRWMMGASMPT